MARLVLVVRRGGSESVDAMLGLLVVAGAAYCAWVLARGLWRVANAGRRAAWDGLKHANRELRDQVVREFPALNFDPADGDAFDFFDGPDEDSAPGGDAPGDGADKCTPSGGVIADGVGGDID